MSGCNLDLLLQSLYKPGDSRSITQNPWLVAIGGQTYAAATDGVRALYLATDGANVIPGAEHLRNKYEPYPMPHLANLLAKVPAPTHQIERSVLSDAVGPGDVVTWSAEECSKCEGSGEIKSRDGASDICFICGGDGSWCERSDFRAIDPLLIGGMPDPPSIDAHLARGIFEQLPGDSIALSAIPGMVVFQGPGWAFLISPLSPWRTARTRHVEAVRILLGGASA